MEVKQVRYKCLLTEFLTDVNNEGIPYGAKFSIIMNIAGYNRLVEDDLISIDKGEISRVCIYKENIPLIVQNTGEILETYAGRGISITTDITLMDIPKLIIYPIMEVIPYRITVNLTQLNNLKIDTIVCILRPNYNPVGDLISMELSWRVLSENELIVESKTSEDMFEPEDIYIAKKVNKSTRFKLYDARLNSDLHREVYARNFKDVFENKKYYMEGE